jgi:thymidylate kinase
MNRLAEGDEAARERGFLIVLEGIDGAGKSTLAPLVCERLRPPWGRALPLSKKFVDYEDAYTRTHLKRLRHIIWDERKPAQDVLGGRHWALLMASWYAALETRTLASNTNALVSDGWYFRAIVKTMEETGLDGAWLHLLFASVRQPDAVVLLDLKPELAFARGRAFDPRESGGRALGGPTDFVTFQSRIRGQLLRMAAQGNWIVAPVGEEHTPEALADIVAKQIEERLGWRPDRHD